MVEGATERQDAVFAAWKQWCERHGCKPRTSQSFARNLRAVVPGLTVARPRMGLRQVRIWQGLRLLPPLPPEGIGLGEVEEEACFMLFDTVLAFDHVRHQILIVANARIAGDQDLESLYQFARAKIEFVERELDRTLSKTAPAQAHAIEITSNVTRDEFEEGQQVVVIDGPFANFGGKIDEVNTEKNKLRVLISILGRVYQNLGLFDDTERLYASAMRIRQDEFGPHSVEVALSLNNLGVLDIARSNFPEAIRRLESAVRIYDTALKQGDQVLRLYRANRADVTERNYATSMANLGLAKVSNGELEEAKPLLQHALRLIDQLDLDDITLHTSAVEALASVYTHEGNYTEAEKLFRNSLAQRLEYHGDDHPLVATTLNNLATVVMALGRYAEAVGPFERSLEIRRAVYGDDHPAIVTGLANLGTLHSRLGKYEVAQRYLRESLELASHVLPQGHTVISRTQYNLATVLIERSEYEAAEQIFREVLTTWRAAAVPNQLHVAKALNGLGRSLVRQERLEEAEEMIDEAITVADPFGSAGAQVVGQGLHNKATIATMRNKPAEAERLLRRTLEICFDVLGEDHPTAGLLLSDLGWSLHMQDRNDDAVKTLRKAYRVQQAALGVEHPNTLTTMQRLDLLGASVPEQIPQ